MNLDGVCLGRAGRTSRGCLVQLACRVCVAEPAGDPLGAVDDPRWEQCGLDLVSMPRSVPTRTILTIAFTILPKASLPNLCLLIGFARDQDLLVSPTLVPAYLHLRHEFPSLLPPPRSLVSPQLECGQSLKCEGCRSKEQTGAVTSPTYHPPAAGNVI
jgi:hypothetical protein